MTMSYNMESYAICSQLASRPVCAMVVSLEDRLAPEKAALYAQAVLKPLWSHMALDPILHDMAHM
ncbi:hypothetical protein DPMN_093917 [Dreissena polymorpha]|uniref:Uncharacterized protein n=1 Tax=Dreissena polymorpha TaxID=45954 RepID=A0A9D4L3U2_DREPO|nr:hypothetical protein DPMN_093917 [Dreissena polymorpha]